MGVNSLPKSVTRERHGCDLNPSPSAPVSCTVTTRLPSHPYVKVADDRQQYRPLYKTIFVWQAVGV